MTIIGKTVTVRDGNITMFMGPQGSGKTRTLVSEILRNYGPLKEVHIYALDPFGDIATCLRQNIDQHPDWQIQRIQIVTLLELPNNMDRNDVLMIDDGRGYYTLVENESSLPYHGNTKALFCTVQVAPARR